MGGTRPQFALTQMMNIRMNGDGRTIDLPLISVADLLVLDHVENRTW